MSNGSSAAAGAFLNLNGSHLRQDCTLRFECVHFCASLYSACVNVACASACVCTSVRSACLHARACVFVCARARVCPFMRVGFVCACAFTCLEVRAICITERHGRRQMDAVGPRACGATHCTVSADPVGLPPVGTSSRCRRSAQPRTGAPPGFPAGRIYYAQPAACTRCGTQRSLAGRSL